jgi:hypothetical protein
MDLFAQRLLTGREASTILRADGLLHLNTEVSEGLRDVEPALPNAGDPSQKAVDAEAAKTKAADKKQKPAGHPLRSESRHATTSRPSRAAHSLP